MSNYYKSEIDQIIGIDFSNNEKKSNIKMIKMQCNRCGHIDYTLKCIECGQPMYKYSSKLK